MTDPLLACLCRCSFFGSSLRHALQQRKTTPGSPPASPGSKCAVADQVEIPLAAGLSLPLRSFAGTRRFAATGCFLKAWRALAAWLCAAGHTHLSPASLDASISTDPRPSPPRKRTLLVPYILLLSLSLLLLFSRHSLAAHLSLSLSRSADQRAPCNPRLVPAHLGFWSSHLIAHLDKYCYSHYTTAAHLAIPCSCCQA